jgi:hypothetical protein
MAIGVWVTVATLVAVGVLVAPEFPAGVLVSVGILVGVGVILFNEGPVDAGSLDPPQLLVPRASSRNTVRVIDFPITRPLINTRCLFNYMQIYKITNRILVAMFCVITCLNI